jgi:LmbE family N-acetylglucosaminyl deacetylase
MPLFGQDPTAFGRNNDINIRRIAEVNAPITTKIDVSPFFEQSVQAANCHTSQLPGIPRGFPGFVQRWFSRYNTFTRIVPQITARLPIERDLFAGVQLD